MSFNKNKFGININTLVIMTALLSFGEVVSVQAGAIRVMTFNIKTDRGVVDGSDAWDYPSSPRNWKCRDLILDNTPDIVGIQEAKGNQVSYLDDCLGDDFSSYFVDRGDGECVGVYYRNAYFDCFDEGKYWLSETPEIPSKHPKAQYNRVVSWVGLHDKRSNEEFYVFNTHWSHVSASARKFSASLMRQMMTEIAGDSPLIITGDLNCSEFGESVPKLLGTSPLADPQLQDAYREIHPVWDGNERTCHSWTGRTDGKRIDFILCSEQFKPTTAEIIREQYDGQWPSDHYPVLCTLVIPEPSTATMLLMVVGFGLFRIRRKQRAS